MLHLKLLEKQEQAKPKTSRRIEIVKMRAKINEIETKKTQTNKEKNPNHIQRIKETKNWFFKKISKIDKTLANLTKMRREKTQISKVRNENGR
jgi:hypothetical protein